MIVPGSANPLLMAQSGDPLDEIGKIERSLRFRSAAGAYLSKIFSGAGATVWTLNKWLKRAKMGAGQGVLTRTGIASGIWFNAGDQLVLGNNGTQVASSAVFRDPAAHLNLHVTSDGTMVTAKINGVTVLSYAGILNGINSANTHILCGYIANNEYFDGYTSNAAFVDGQVIPETAFVRVHPRTGQLRPKKKAEIKAVIDAGGVNSFFLSFDDTTNPAALCADASNKGNHWTASNISSTSGATYDSMGDTPTNNFATLNPLKSFGSVSTSNGNLDVSIVNYSAIQATQGASAGKWYWEITVNSAAATTMIGVSKDVSLVSGTPAATANGYYYTGQGHKYTNGGGIAYGETYASGDVIGVALDMDAGIVRFYKNGLDQGVAFTGLAGQLFPSLENGNIGTTKTFSCNFGQRPFAYIPPDDFNSFCTKNLPILGSTVATSGSFTGNASTAGPFVSCGGTPETLKINGNAVTWGTHADRLANGFKLRTSSASYNSSGTNNWTATILSPEIKSTFRYQNAKAN
ncbi:SPRY domain-containing protein [Azonexus sp. R2A61]|uniref:SPRY domain-containing protein n=1 Tax=Azonexus sp. R2A61 TaxID=2744443 RepID=UPI001F3D0AE6|nr:SPRY domain-containing protein [Azonexus sp. R2A61]